MNWKVDRRTFFASSATAAATFALFRPARAAAPHFKTVSPGALTVAMNGDMPMTSVKAGRLIGTDGEMITAIAQRLGLSVKPALMEWSATIESIRSRRADIMLGDMGWTPVRAKVLLLTDAIYYVGKQVAMNKNNPLAKMTVGDMKGHSIGTVSGFTIVPDLKKVPGITDVKLYDTTDACIRDVLAGQLDFAMLDAPTVDYMILQNPNWGMKQIPLLYDAALPVLTRKDVIVMGMNESNPDLFDAVNDGVKWMWKTKLNVRTLVKYGLSNPDYLMPPEPNPRVGADRDANDNLIGPGAHKMKDYSALFA